MTHESQNRRLWVGVGVAVVARRNGEILLIKRQGSHGADTWAPPGGHIDFGENIEDTARREVWEEVGVRIQNLKVLGFTNDIFKKDKKHYITIWVECDWKSGEPKMKNDEMSEIGWFGWKELPSPLFLPLENFIRGRIMP